MCIEALWKWLRCWVVQAKARWRYRLDKFRANRARNQWLRRELKGGGWTYHEVDNNLAHVIYQPDHPYMPTTFSSPDFFEEEEDEEEDGADRHTEQGVGVLSPQRLSQRLNENALAREAVGESDAELAQYLKDERIALFLQNDEFMNELRTNREFISALQEDYESEAGDEVSEGGQDKGQLPQLDDATLRERIATMGKASRKKFAQIAKVFSRRKRSTGRSLPSGGQEQLLISAEPLVDEEEEERQPQVSGNHFSVVVLNNSK